MMKFNLTILTGNAGSDPELRATKDGTPVLHFSLPVDSYEGKDEDGNARQTTEWVRVNVWGKYGESMSKLIKKGTPVLVSGKLQIRHYTDKNNVERTSVELRAEEVKLQDSKPKREEQHEG